MATLSGLGIGLSLVFGLLLLALVAELYYLLWWKKRVVNTESEEDCRSHSKGFLSLLCRRRPASVHNSSTDGHGGDRNPDGNGHEQDLELGSSKDLLLKPFGEEGIEAELMRLHNLAGPPRFLFTIKEETKEDLETESVKSRTRSLSDLVMAVDTPFLTPLASPMKSFNQLGFNPLFESSVSGEELTRLRSSPPPTFKFLRDAEEKLLRRLKEEEAEKRVSRNGDFVSSRQDYEGKGESFETINVSKNRESHELQQQQQQQRCNLVPPQKFPPSSSQVLPLASSPTTLRPQ